MLRCCCAAASEVLILLVHCCCWYVVAANALMLLMHWLMLQMYWCCWCADALMLLMHWCYWSNDAAVVDKMQICVWAHLKGIAWSSEFRTVVQCLVFVIVLFLVLATDELVGVGSLCLGRLDDFNPNTSQLKAYYRSTIHVYLYLSKDFSSQVGLKT